MASKRASDRRPAERVKLRAPVKVCWGDLEVRGFIHDISESGMLIDLTRLLDIGQRVHVVLEGDEPLSAEGVVVRQKKRPTHARSVLRQGIGIRFLTLLEAMNYEDCVPLQMPMEVDLRDRAALQAAYDRDIKHGGMRVTTTEIAELDDEVMIPVHLPDPHPAILCKAMIVKILDQGFAVRLVEVDPVREHLAGIIREK